MKPQDILVVLALNDETGDVSYPGMSSRLKISASECHGAVKRLQSSGLVDGERRVVRHAMLEFLLHGFKYVFPAELGPPSLGVPTAAGAPALRKHFSPGEPLVWPSAKGSERGISIKPLYRSVPEVSLHDPSLYESLALLDCLRAGRARERKFATKRLTTEFASDGNKAEVA